MKPLLPTKQGQERRTWNRLRGVSRSLLGGISFLKTATHARSTDLSLGESLLDNIGGEFGYVAAVEELEELLLQKELLVDGYTALFVSRAHRA